MHSIFLTLCFHVYLTLCMHACSVTQSCQALCDPMECNPPGSSVHGILRQVILEWVAMSSSGDLPNPGIKPTYPALAGEFFTTAPPGKPIFNIYSTSQITLAIFQMLNRYVWLASRLYHVGQCPFSTCSFKP